MGGVDAPNGTGVFVLSLHGAQGTALESFCARKSWFALKDTILCLGSGIRNSKDSSVQLTASKPGTTALKVLCKDGQSSVIKLEKLNAPRQCTLPSHVREKRIQLLEFPDVDIVHKRRLLDRQSNQSLGGMGEPLRLQFPKGLAI